MFTKVNLQSHKQSRTKFKKGFIQNVCLIQLWSVSKSNRDKSRDCSRCRQRCRLCVCNANDDNGKPDDELRTDNGYFSG